MQFTLFSKKSFTVSNPIGLVEAYCFQSDFYSKYDLLSDRRVVDVNKIGARIRKELLYKCEAILKKNSKLRLFQCSLDDFFDLSEEIKKEYIMELTWKVVVDLLKIKGIGFSRVTKILHTLYPEIIPMIDSPLQDFYRSEVNSEWSEEESGEILVEYYNNLIQKKTWQNINQIFKQFRKNKIPGLTKLRVFDILWWSYLKSENLRKTYDIKWSSIF